MTGPGSGERPTNKAIAAWLDEIADLIEIDGVDVRKAGAYRRAARTVSALRDDLFLYYQQDRLQELPGIGPAIAGKIRDFYQQGTTRLLEDLRARIPQEVRGLLAVPGLGPRTAGRLYRELGVASLEHLRRALEEGTVAQLPGFGPSRARKLLDALKRLEAASARLPLAYALEVAVPLTRALQQLPGVERAAVAGSVRRGRDTVKDVDLVAAARRPEPVAEAFQRLPMVQGVELAGSRRVRVQVEGGVPVDLRIVSPDAFAAAWHHLTGSAAHHLRLRGRAHTLGLQINEYGVFRTGGARAEALPVPDEEALYRYLELDYIPPELREDRGEVEAAAQGSLPVLVEAGDLRGDLHVHSRWSDGAASIQEMAEAARARGYRYLAICDHSRSLRVAHGLDIVDLEAQWREIDDLNRRYAEEGVDFRILKGAEVDVLKDGRLDYPDEILARLDVVVASIHTHLGLDRQAMTQRLLAAMEHPHVDIIGHPTGRRLGVRDPYAVDLEAVIAAAARTGTALEINSSPERLDLSDEAARRAAEAGVWLVVNTDAHAPEQLAQVVFGITVARRAWLGKGHLVNALDLPALRRWLQLPKERRAQEAPRLPLPPRQGSASAAPAGDGLGDRSSG